MHHVTRYCLVLFLLISFGHYCFGQTDQIRPEELLLKERLAELGVDIPSRISKLDNVTVRNFLRLRIATVLWADAGEESSAQAKSVAIAGLEDLNTHRDQVPPLYETLFRRDLMALLEAHAPEAAKRFEKESDANAFEVAYAALTTKGNESLAIDLVNRALADRQVPDSSIIFFLRRLEQEQSARIPELLSNFLTVEERQPGTISVEMLFWLADFYLGPNRAPQLRERFVTVAVMATADSYSWSDAARIRDAYDLLRIVTPLIPSIAPSLSARANAQLASLTGRFSDRPSDRDASDERIRTSDDPLEQTISEARSANDPELKDDLFVEASQLALKKGKLKLAFELTMSISSEGQHQKLRTQFLNELVNSAIEKKDPELAGLVIARIDASLIRAAALQRLSLYFFDLKDVAKAKETLIDSLKVINSIEDKTDKTLALLKSLRVVIRVNDEMTPDLAAQLVRAINQIPGPNQKDTSTRDEYIRKTLMPVVWQVLPAFEMLAQRDETIIPALVDQLEPREVKLAALSGASVGRLSVARRNLAATTKVNKPHVDIKPN